MGYSRGRSMEPNMSWIKKTVHSVIAIGAVAVLPAMAQPAAPITDDYLCQVTPTSGEVASTTVDADGYTPLFDGSTWKGLWQDCQASHSSGDRVKGAIWRIDPVEHAIYSTQRNGNVGGLLLTKHKYGSYEVTFDMWPSFGDDGGFFNRTTPGGTCYQTVMDYIQGASFGGTWPEGGYQGSYDFRPTKYNSGTDPHDLNTTAGGNDRLPADGGHGGGGWTVWTGNHNKPSNLGLPQAEALGCAASGCLAADWNRLWSFDGWNQVRIKFYGGTAAGTGKIHMQSAFRKLGATMWVPIWADSIIKVDTPSFIGFQVHGGGRFGGAKGNWYRNYKIRELDNEGKPLVTVAMRRQNNGVKSYALSAASGMLAGNIDEDHTITVRDMQGRVLEVFSGAAGNINYSFTSKVNGLLTLDIKTAKGITHQRVTRI